jgi:hypothetical protein
VVLIVEYAGQDLGTTNFSFLSPEPMASRERNFSIVTRALARVGAPAVANGRNDIELHGKKVLQRSSCSSVCIAWCLRKYVQRSVLD